MPRTITFIRHAETEANAQRRWQGSLDSGFSDRGRDQIGRLADRFREPAPGLVASDLTRAAETAGAIGVPKLDERWREFHVGGWEGLTSEEIEERFPGDLTRLFGGEDFAIGGGERMSVFRERIGEAFDELVDDLDDGEEATVVTHGGVILSMLNLVIDAPGGWSPMIPPHNTAITRVRVDEDGSRQVYSFNDATHLDHLPVQFGTDGTVVTVFRHGQTLGNLAHRWQGRSDSDLTEHGMWQASRASEHAPDMDVLFSSPLGRAMSTAEIIALRAGVEVVADDGLAEMSFGAWESMTLAEAAESKPELFEAIYDRGEDLPRGGDGESFTEAGERIASTIRELVSRNGYRSMGVVSHGAVIRAYAAGIAGLGFRERNRIPVPRNSSMTRFVHGQHGVALASYNVAPHLDES